MRKISKHEKKELFPELATNPGEAFLLTEEEVKTLIERSALSGLPGNTEIKNEIMKTFIKGSAFNIIVYFDLNNFKSYNDNYGFIKGDKVIKFIAERIMEINKGFSGHIGGDDFVAIMKEDDFDNFARELLMFFEIKLKDFYDIVDYERGGIFSFDREGNRKFFPLMGGTLVAFKNNGEFSDPESVGEYAAQLKNIAKIKGDCFIGNSVVFRSKEDNFTPLKSIIFDKKIPLNLRRGVIESLGEIKDYSYENIIMEVLKSEKGELFLKKSALYALGKLRVKETVPVIKNYLEHSSAHIRMRAVEALGEIGMPEKVITESFDDRNYYVRKAAVIAAGRTGDNKFIPLLKKKLKDGTLGNFAFISLAYLGDEETLKNIPAFVKSANVHPEIRIEALSILSTNGGNLTPRGIKEIFKDIEKEPPGFIAEALLAAAKLINFEGEIFKPYEYNTIFGFSENSSWKVRRALCELVSLSRRNEAYSIVRKLCFDSNTGVRVKAIESLKFFPDKFNFLLKLFGDPDEVIRAKAISTISFMDIPEDKLPGVIEKLRLQLKDPSHEVAENSAKTILVILRKK